MAFSSVRCSQVLEGFWPKSMIFQQDNDPKHTALINKAYLVNQQVNILDWPAQSPDLNSIENLWSDLDRQLQDRNCNTPNQLFEVLQAGWAALTPEYLENLVDSILRCCAEQMVAQRNTSRSFFLLIYSLRW
jgi:hypothetical protein